MLIMTDAYIMRGAVIILISLFTYIITHSALAAGADTMTAKEYFAKGKMMYNQGKSNEALLYLNNSTNADVNYGEAWFYKAKVLCDLCREKEAKEAWEKARDLGYEKAIISPLPECCADVTPVSNNFSESRSITWNFEVGGLTGWYPTGKAFEGQPECAPSEDKPSGIHEECWIGTGGYDIGNLTSRPFRILGDRMDFLIGGCSNCSVSLIVNDTPVMTAYGHGTEAVERVVWDVSAYKRKIAYLRLSDESSCPVGRLYFDDVNFDIAPRLMDSASLGSEFFSRQ
jgi:tetratricopeptide (TPR) repeat protein